MVALSLGTGVAAAAFRRPGPPAPPAPIDPPRLAGSGRIGTVVRADPGRWSGAPGLAYQWRLDGADLPGATGPSYDPVPADDRGRLAVRVTATNAGGRATAETRELAVTWPPPRAAGGLPDVSYSQHSGFQTVNASTDFTGEALRFSVAGEGVSVDPETGVLRVSTEALRAGLEVVVTAENSGGVATSRFRLTVAEAPVEKTNPPAPTAAPELSGTGRIGEAVALDPGTWAGTPEPALALQWLRDGAPISGATGPSYTPGPGDDLAELAARVTATNVAGQAAAETAPLAVTWPAPRVVGPLADLALPLGGAAQPVEAGAAFAGGALVFSVSGAGATVDPATGRVSIPTALPLAGAQVTVTATNSGGSAATGFRVTVATPVPAPAAVGALPDMVYEQGSGVQTVSAQAGFGGADLAFALDTAPAGVTVNPGSGLVSIPTDALVAGAKVTVRARNSGGAATQSFRVTVRSTRTVFDAAAKLAEMRFLSQATPPGWTHETAGFARLMPAASDRAHGDWSKAGGDGLYRCLVRWNTASPETGNVAPFVFGVRVRQAGANFTGAYVNAFQPKSGTRQLRLHQFTGAGTATTVVATASPGWKWNTWYWLEVELAGASIKARLFAEAAAAPAWQLTGTTSVTGTGAFGPGGFGGAKPVIDMRRLEYHPPGAAAAAPPAAEGGDWTLGQIGVQ